MFIVEKPGDVACQPDGPGGAWASAGLYVVSGQFHGSEYAVEVTELDEGLASDPRDAPCFVLDELDCLQKRPPARRSLCEQACLTP